MLLQAAVSERDDIAEMDVVVDFDNESVVHEIQSELARFPERNNKFSG